MSATIRCSHCGKTYRFRPDLAGKKIKCTWCGLVFVAPANQPDDAAHDPFGLDDGPAAPSVPPRSSQPTPPQRRRRARSRTVLGPGAGPLLGFAAIVVAVFLVVLLYWATRPANPPRARDDFFERAAELPPRPDEPPPGRRAPQTMDEAAFRRRMEQSRQEAIQRLVAEYGQDRVASVEYTGFPTDWDMQLIASVTWEDLSRTAFNGYSTKFSGRVILYVLAPIDDPDRLAAALKLGDARIDRSQRHVIVRVDAARLPSPEERRKHFVGEVDLISLQAKPRRSELVALARMTPNERRREVLDAVVPLLHHDDLFTRRDAVDVVVQWGGADHLPELFALIDEDNPVLRSHVLRALDELHDRRMTPHLVPLLHHEDGSVQRQALRLLGRVNDDPQAAEAVAEVLPSLPLRSEAVLALKSMGPVAEPYVLRLLEAADLPLRIEICNLLAAIGTEKSIPALTAITKRRSLLELAVADAASRALRAIHARHPAKGDSPLLDGRPE